MTAQPMFQPPQPAALPRPAGIPKFEGSEVASTITKMVGSVPITADDDIVVSMDDRMRLVGEFRVVAVNFKTDPKTGDIVREHLVKVVNIQLCPWDPTDPTDDGIVRARP